MKERPILFSAPMVRAILEGRKTQTRRVIKSPFKDREIVFLPDHELKDDGSSWYGENPDRNDPYNWGFPNMIEYDQLQLPDMSCPFGQVGDQLWVRENFSIIDMTEGYQNEFVSDDFECPMARVKFADGETVTRELICQPDMGIDDVSQARRALKKKTVPSIHMPRWASRIQLEITGIRLERLKDISNEDAKAEGLKGITKDGNLVKYGIPDTDGLPGEDNIGWPWHEWHQDPRLAFCKLWSSINGEKSWDANPWVWVVEFKVVKQ